MLYYLSASLGAASDRLNLETAAALRAAEIADAGSHSFKTVSSGNAHDRLSLMT